MMIETERNKEKTYILKSGAKIVFIALLFSCIASHLLVRYQLYNEQNYKLPNELQTTQEYQTNLYTEQWENREKKMKEFFSYFSEVTGFDITSITLQENYRHQADVRTENCTISWPYHIEFRVRNYFAGPSSNMSTVDAKIGDLSYNMAMISPLQPSYKFLENSNQKLERDVHPCYTKYSRETRVTPSYEPEFVTCGDIHRYFPSLWENEEINERKVRMNSWEFWYTGVYKGRFENGVEFKTDITLRYNSLEDVLAGETEPRSGEFSLRIWSMHHGHGMWNQTALLEIDDWYKQLYTKFGSKDDYPC